MAKYEAGQMWVSGDNWFVVMYADQNSVRIAEGGRSRWHEDYATDSMDNVFAGYTLTNPRGLREAAEKMVKYATKCDMLNAPATVEGLEWDDIQALRAALEGGAA